MFGGSANTFGPASDLNFHYFGQFFRDKGSKHVSSINKCFDKDVAVEQLGPDVSHRSPVVAITDIVDPIGQNGLHAVDGGHE